MHLAACLCLGCVQDGARFAGKRHSLKSAASLQDSKVECWKEEAMQSRKGWTNCQFGMLSLHALVDALVEGYQIQYVYRTLKVLKTTSFY